MLSPNSKTHRNLHAKPSLRDEVFQRQQLDRTLQLRNDPRPWIESYLHILTKEGKIVPLRFNAAQKCYYDNRTNRGIILKARQLGCTTLLCALFLADCLLRPNRVSLIVAHDSDSAQRIFQIVRLMWQRMPDAWQRRYPTRFDNKGEMWWIKQNSRIFVGTAGSAGLGRGLTIHNLLVSELAHWPHPEEALAGLLEAVPADGRVVIESTPKGLNFFHTLWNEARHGQSGYQPFFFPWFADPEYRRPGGPPLGALSAEEEALQHTYRLEEAQLRWRREKQQQLRDKFIQEYPEDDATCFLTSGRCCFPVPELMTMRESAVRLRSSSIQTMALYRWSIGRHFIGSINVAPGRLTVWQEPHIGSCYAIGADVAEGLEHGDYSAAVVFDIRTQEQVAELHGKWRPDVFAKLLAALGASYGWAFIGVESNGHGLVTLHVLENELGYHQLFYYQTGISGRGGFQPGWPTTSKTKAFIIDQLASDLTTGKIFLRSPVLLACIIRESFGGLVLVQLIAVMEGYERGDDVVGSLGVASRGSAAAIWPRSAVTDRAGAVFGIMQYGGGRG
jgi:hypothetical protein